MKDSACIGLLCLVPHLGRVESVTILLELDLVKDNLTTREGLAALREQDVPLGRLLLETDLSEHVDKV